MQDQPIGPSELIVDHSIQVDYYATIAGGNNNAGLYQPGIVHMRKWSIF